MATGRHAGIGPSIALFFPFVFPHAYTRTDGRTDRQADRRTDRKTDSQSSSEALGRYKRSLVSYFTSFFVLVVVFVPRREGMRAGARINTF